MKKHEKQELIDNLAKRFEEAQYFYFIDESTLNAAQTSSLRRKAFESEIQYSVVKNTLIKKALEKSNKGSEELYSVLKGPTAVFFSSSSNAIAKMIKEYRKEKAKPELKAAYIDSDIFVGDDQLKSLINLKSKNELIGEIIGLLQSPIKNVVSGLQNESGQKIASLLKSIENK
ncbi:MAG: 50S ribosomal protein L10 [Chitinophagales bacterium]|jgi:large subunit ribosomal protein L10|nr:50S ribosomal protein L10 [Chitinophagales bacterium]